jgi:hypothetical protein
VQSSAQQQQQRTDLKQDTKLLQTTDLNTAGFMNFFDVGDDSKDNSGQRAPTLADLEFVRPTTAKAAHYSDNEKPTVSSSPAASAANRSVLQRVAAIGGAAMPVMGAPRPIKPSNTAADNNAAAAQEQQHTALEESSNHHPSVNSVTSSCSGMMQPRVCVSSSPSAVSTTSASEDEPKPNFFQKPMGPKRSVPRSTVSCGSSTTIKPLNVFPHPSSSSSTPSAVRVQQHVQPQVLLRTTGHTAVVEDKISVTPSPLPSMPVVPSTSQDVLIHPLQVDTESTEVRPRPTRTVVPPRNNSSSAAVVAQRKINDLFGSSDSDNEENTRKKEDQRSINIRSNIQQKKSSSIPHCTAASSSSAVASSSSAVASSIGGAADLFASDSD